MLFPFAKYVGCGNDFILFDHRMRPFPWANSKLVQRLCSRHWGIGADGLLLVEHAASADARMRIFNANGSEAEMCGNGLRCLTHWLHTKHLCQTNFVVEVFGKHFQTAIHPAGVSIDMGMPTQMEFGIELLFKEKLLQVHALNTGVPHAVVCVDAIAESPISEWGYWLRHHPRWDPQGTNVTLMEQVGPQELRVRTYERGVEGETLACGTGAVAAAIVAVRTMGMSSPIDVITSSKEKLIVEISPVDFSRVVLTGPAKCVFNGEMDLFDCV